MDKKRKNKANKKRKRGK